MIKREDILSLEFLKKTEFTGCNQGMRYRLEGAPVENGRILKVTVWPEPFNFFKTAEELKQSAAFAFTEEGVEESVLWMNDRLQADREKWENAGSRWSDYKMD